MKIRNVEFSVLISVYYREEPKFLKSALESIWYDQTLQPTEIVLVKDGPVGKALDSVINDFAFIAPLKIVSLSKNSGLGIALANGLDACSYKIIVRMDSDDLSLPNRFEKQVNYLELNPLVDIVGSWIKEFDSETGEIYGARVVPESHSEISALMKTRNPISHPSVAFRKEMILKVGSYVSYPLLEDYNLWVRCLQEGAVFHNLQEYLLLFRAGKAVVKRRGGMKYLKTEISFQNWLRKIRFISITTYLLNCIKRIIIRVVGNNVRYFVYNRFLRNRIVE